jgi:hypothetical protein
MSFFQFLSVVDILGDVLLINHFKPKRFEQVSVGIDLSLLKVVSEYNISTRMHVIFTKGQYL